MNKIYSEGFDPYNLNHSNPFENLDLNEVCYFDTETTGLKPVNCQIVEIAAKLGEKQFYKKIKLTEETLSQIAQQEITPPFKRGKPDKTIKDLLQMTGYHEGEASSVEEEMALIQFEQFVEPAKALVAHNASFDMNMINRRRSKYSLSPIKRIKVIDTVYLSSRFMVPALLAIERGDYKQSEKTQAKQILDAMAANKFDAGGKRKKISNALGSISTAIFGNIKGWHQAMADVDTLKNIVENFMVLFFNKHYGSGIEKLPVFQKYYMGKRKRS